MRAPTLRMQLFWAGLLLFTLSAQARDRRTLASLPPEARETAITALQWTDQYWDARAGLLWDTHMDPQPRPGETRHHVVRDSIWYAVGLMLRDQAGDRERSLQAIAAVLKQQLNDPSQPYNGTFYRSAEEPHPPARYAQLFVHYDPNWREFIGTTLVILLEEYSDRLPEALQKQMTSAIERAVSSEITEGRLRPDYSNIALMHGFLWSWAGKRLQRPEWIRGGRQFSEEVYRLFNEHGNFEEYNSPTYYGVDLYALSLWRNYGPEPWFIKSGSDMEARLWTDIASYYHPGMKNLSGPFDRSYGMDMQSYVSLVGLWLRTTLGAEAAPFPKIGGRMVHSDDMQYAPVFALLGTEIPKSAVTSFLKFGTEHQIRRELPRDRVATAWIGRDFMLGGEATGATRETSGQYVPATAYWKTPSGDTAWMALAQGPRSDSRVDKQRLYVTGIGDFTFRVSASGSDVAQVKRDTWALPGITVHVATDAGDMSVKPVDGHLEITYREATRIELRFESK